MELLEYYCRLEHLLSTFRHDDIEDLERSRVRISRTRGAILSPALLLVAFMIVELVDLEFEEL